MSRTTEPHLARSNPESISGDVRSATARIPRVVTACLTYAIIRHLIAAATTLGSPGTIRTIDWVALATAEFVLLCVALWNPTAFRVRDLRLVGVFTASNALIILAPLPDVIAVFDAFVPRLMIISLATGIATMAMVFLAASKLRPVEPGSTHGTRTGDSKVTEPAGRNEWILPTAVVIVSLMVIPAWYALGGAPPLLGLFGGSSSLDLAASRQAALSDLSSAPLRVIIGVLRNLLLMFTVGWFAASAASTPRTSRRDRGRAELTAMAVAGIGAVLALWTTERAVLGEMLAIGAMSIIVVRRRELSAKVVGTLVGVAAAFPFAVGFISGAGNATEVLIGLRRRAFYLPAEVMTRYFIEFPAFHEHLNGSSIPKLSYLTGGESFDLSRHIYQRYYQRGLGYVGNANGSFWGVGWANFGFMGVVLWSLAAAVALVLIDRGIDRLPIRSGAALRGLGVVLTVLMTSSDIFRSVIGFLPGYLDLLVLVWVVTRVTRARTIAHGRIGPEPVPTSVRSTATTIDSPD